MEIQVPMAASSSPTAAATGGNTLAVATGTTGKAGTRAAQGSFTQVLGGQMTQETAAEAADPAITLAGLLQMLQSLTLPIQSLQLAQGEQIGEQQLPELLLQAMNSNEALADHLLKDAGLQKWFAQAADLLNALPGTNLGNNHSLMLQSQQASTTNMQAQSTLLLLTSMLEKQPDNPFLQHLVQDLQKAMQPLMPMLKEASVNTEGSAEVTGDAPVTHLSEMMENGLVGSSASGEQSGKESRNKREGEQLKKNEQSAVFDVEIVPAPKSKLELLAAKNAISASLIQSQTAPTEVTSGPEPVSVPVITNVDIDAGNSNFVWTDTLKAPQVETAARAVPVTISFSNFAEEMTQHVLKNMKITLNEGLSEAKLSLFPKNLGHVDVRITMHEGQLIAQFATDTLAGKQMLESQLSQLRQALQSQGLQVEKLEVTQNQSMQSGMFQEQRQQHQSKQSSLSNKNNLGNYDQETSEFIQELSGATQTRNHVNGNSFDATA